MTSRPSYIGSLENLQDRVFNAADWAPSQSEEALYRVTQWLNEAQYRLVNEAPWLFSETHYELDLEPNIQPASATDLLRTTTDEWVLETELLVGDADAVVWEDNRHWAGRILSIEDPDTSEKWYDFRIREVFLWETSPGSGSFRVRMTLWTPWHLGTKTGLNWRVLNSEIVLPEDLVELRSITLTRNHTDYPLRAVGETTAEQTALTNKASSIVVGIPRWYYKREPQQLRAPNYQPVATVDDLEGTAWNGTEPKGKFEYCFTYGWGRWGQRRHRPGPHEQGTLVGSVSRYQPYWESGPSPVSDAVAHDATGVGAIRLSLPNIDHVMGFDDAATPRYHQAGLKKYIYRRRLEEDPATAVGLDPSDRFYLIAEVDGHITEYVDSGIDLPDRMTPLRPVQRYATFGVYPNPDNEYTVNIRAVVRPKQLVDKGDIPQIPADGTALVVAYALVWLYRHQGNAAMAAHWDQEAKMLLFNLQKRHASLRPSSKPRRRRVASVRHKSGYYGNYPLVVET